MPWTKIYSNRTEFEKALKDNPDLRGITYREAIREATSQLLSSDPSVFVIGEGVDDAGGVFGTTKGLHEEFGTKRVMDSPLSENGITGIAVGSAAQHSQSLQAMFMNIPGLKVIMPATPFDAKGMLISAVKDGNPVVMIEHRWLYEHVGYVPT